MMIVIATIICRLIFGITFFAFSQYMGQITRNIYFAVATGGLIATPGTFACIFIIKRFGRRLTVCFFQLLTATCFLIIIFIPKGVFRDDWPRVAVAGTGLLGMSVSDQLFMDERNAYIELTFRYPYRRCIYLPANCIQR